MTQARPILDSAGIITLRLGMREWRVPFEPLDITPGRRIAVTFTDSKVRNVTPEQISVALSYLARVANALTLPIGKE
jgi:hypothetical protein